MKFLKYFFFFIFLKCQILICQESLKRDFTNILKKDYSNEEKIQKLNKLFLLYKKPTLSAEKGLLYSEIATLYFKTGKKKLVVPTLLQSIAILQQYKKNYLYDLNKARNNLSMFYLYEGQIKDQLNVLQEIIKDKAKDDITFFASIILAKADANRGDYYLSLKKLNFLLAEKQSIEKEITIRRTIIQIYAMMTEFDIKKKLASHQNSILNHQKFIENNFDQSLLDKKLLFECYNNLANIYESFGNYEEALRLYLKSKTFFKEQKKDYEYFFVLNNIGYLYAKQQKFKEAIPCFKEIIHHSTDVNQIATAYDNLGYFSQVKPIDKTAYFQIAIQTILENPEKSFNLPSVNTIIDSGYQQEVLVYLVDLAYNYVESYKTTKNKTYLFKAKETLYLIDALVSLIRYESNSEQSKLFWIEKGVNTYMLAAEVCYLLQQPEEGFYFIEKNKALLLQENIKLLQAKLALEIPKKMLEQEYKLYYELLVIEKKYLQNPNDAVLKQNFRKKNIAFQQFMTALSNKFPEYTKLKQKVATVSLTKVVDNLSKEECFVTYILNEQDGYGIFCSQKEKHFFKIDKVFAFQKDLKTFSSYLLERNLESKERRQFQGLSNMIFNKLFPFKDALSKIKNKKITIVPDEALLKIPFEALTVSTKTTLKESYLINFSEISYLQSFSVFEKMKQNKNHAKKKLLAIAPCQFEDQNLVELAGSTIAVAALKDYQATDVLMEENATKANFYQARNNYEIIHINSHAGINPLTDSPWISFRKEKLTLEELYGIDNQCELVILDACKTNDGKLASGEGIISLSRGFFVNGAKSVLASLWNVNEKAGNKIIASFYNGLEQGMSKSKALQTAKIKYLKEHEYAQVLPFYWASFTLTGDTTGVAISKSWINNELLFVGLIAIVGLILFFIYKQKLFFWKA